MNIHKLQMFYKNLLLLLQGIPTRGNYRSLSTCCMPGTWLIILHAISIDPPNRNNPEEQILLVPYSKTEAQRATYPGVTQLVSGGAMQVCLTSNLCFFS